MAQHPALVLHAVLHADHRRVRAAPPTSCVERVVGVLPLDGEQDDRSSVASHEHLARDPSTTGTGSVTVSSGASRTRPDAQGPAVVAPGHQRDVVATLEQAAADRTADGTGSHDDEAHGVHSATRCQAFAVASLNPVERAAALGGSVAAAPLRLVGGLAAPARADMARNVRRAIGIAEERAPIATDPDEAFLPPGRRWPAGSTPTCPPC